jgi:hypothetical protein
MLKHTCDSTAKPAIAKHTLSGMDEAGLLRSEFDKHADVADGNKGERRMSTAGLACLMRAQGLSRGRAVLGVRSVRPKIWL